MNEEKIIVAATPLPLPPPDLSTVAPPKRRKGRPPKNRDLLPAGENCAASLPPKPDGRGRRRKRNNGDVALPPVDSTLVGQQVHGVLDGSFDAGYLLTVRVGNTQTMLRGAVFEPSLSVPISQANDIAPHLKFISRSEQVISPSPCLEERATNPALPLSAGPSSSAGAFVKLGNFENAHIPSEVNPSEIAQLLVEEDRPSEALSLEPSLMSTMPTTEYHRDSTLFWAKDHGTEEKIDLQTEQESQQNVATEACVS